MFLTSSNPDNEPDRQHVPDPGVGDDPDVVGDERDGRVHHVAEAEDDRTKHRDQTNTVQTIRLEKEFYFKARFGLQKPKMSSICLILT